MPNETDVDSDSWAAWRRLVLSQLEGNKVALESMERDISALRSDFSSYKDRTATEFSAYRERIASEFAVVKYQASFFGVMSAIAVLLLPIAAKLVGLKI